MTGTIFRTEQDGEIRPEQIDCTRHFFDAFDNMETEISAKWIVKFAQARARGWAPFSYEDINGFYSRTIKDGYRFNRLVNPEMVPPSLARAFAGIIEPRVPVGGGWIVKIDELYYITDEFVRRCFKSSPAAVPTAN